VSPELRPGRFPSDPQSETPETADNALEQFPAFAVPRLPPNRAGRGQTRGVRSPAINYCPGETALAHCPDESIDLGGLDAVRDGLRRALAS
jgi:acetylornithine deacetylase/succinyl-diaminopimelate desuccinylase-like protein